MSKAMLIMDMPSSCLHCSCSNILHGKSRCEETGENLTVDDIYEQRPTWCPLREVPSKHEDGHTLKVAIANDCYDDTVQDDAWCEGVDKGYNACIDEILGGGE